MSSTTKCIIQIDENGPRIESNGNVVASDLKLTLKDYVPVVTNWTTWNGTLNKGDEINITTPYSFVAVRARNINASQGSAINPSSPDLTSACLPANNSLASNCGCNASGEENNEVLLDFELNQFTNYTLDTNTIYSDNTLIFDCTHGTTASGVTGWIGCTGTTGGSGVTGSLGATCEIGATAVAKGVYVYSFTGFLKDNNIVIKTPEADSEYKCDKDYYAYVKADNSNILYIFDDTNGKWVFVKLDQKISDIVENKTPFTIIELIEWSESSYTYKSSNITMPSEMGYTGTNTYEGTITEQDENMPVTFKINSLLIMESKTFTGKFISKIDGLDVNVLLAT